MQYRRSNLRRLPRPFGARNDKKECISLNIYKKIKAVDSTNCN